MHTLKPLDADAVVTAARETGALFTLEEHSVIGGLGSAVAEILAEDHDHSACFKRFGLPSSFSHVTGSQEYLRAYHGLSADALVNAICVQMEKVRTLTATADN
jgi:transketolase